MRLRGADDREVSTMMIRLLLIGCLVVGYMHYVSPFLVTGGAELLVMGGWFVGVVPIALFVWRLP
jgi:hypothetical protein